MATDYAAYSVSPEAESQKHEITFMMSAFNDTVKYTDIQAYALKLQELILMEAGTNPAAVGMGIGIRNYLFEFLDSITLENLAKITLEQQRKYLPSTLVKDIEYRSSGLKGERNMVHIFVYLNEYDENYSNNYFAIGVGIDASKTSKVLSQIYM